MEGELPPRAAALAINAAMSGCKGGAHPSGCPAVSSGAGAEDQSLVNGHTRLSAFGSRGAASGLTRLSAFTAKPVSRGGATRPSGFSTMRRSLSHSLPGQLSLSEAFANSQVPPCNIDALSEVTGHLRFDPDVANLHDLEGCDNKEPRLDISQPVVPKRRKLRLKKRDGWVCPICKRSVFSKGWVQHKQVHVNRWHPHLRKWLRLPREPFNPRVHGPRHASYIRDARQRAANAKKGIAVSRRLHKAKAYRGPHKPCVLRIPQPPRGTHTRSGNPIKRRLVPSPTVVCLKCTRQAGTIDRLIAQPCSITGVGGPKRAQQLRRLLTLVEDYDAEVETREQAATAFRILSPLAVPAAAEAAEHNIVHIRWPFPQVKVGGHRGPSSFCTVCLQTATSPTALRGSSICPGKAEWSARRQAVISVVRAHLPQPTASADERARRILALLSPAEGVAP